MILESYSCGPFGTNALLIGCEKTKRGIFVDPAFESAPKLLSAANRHALHIEAIYLTHSHWDHIVDVAQLKDELSLNVYVHPKDAENLRHPGSDGVPMQIELQGAEPTHFLEEGQIHQVGALRFIVIHTPGHCPGAVCFYFEEQQVLISGDTLFKGTIGSLSLPTAEANLMWESLQKLSLLPPTTKVYPGHGESTTLKNESWIKNAKELFG
jgi:hydroxyacylglutathione hydrolase